MTMTTDDSSNDLRRLDLSGEPDRQELEALWDELGDAAPAPSAPLSVDAEWERLSSRLFSSSAADAPSEAAVTALEPARRPARSSWRALRVAASIAAVFAGGLGVWNSVPASVQAAAGERVTAVLPGGSTVDLNAGSTLRWKRGFAWLPGVDRSERVVWLDGEGFFDVATDGRPFRVETTWARVAVLGTRFNVRARPGEGTSVTVDEGSVEVRDPTEGAVVLVAGQRVVAGSGAGPLEVVEAGSERAQAWREGGFFVSDQPVLRILGELERRFSTQIDASALDDATRMRQLNLYYSSPIELESILDDVATTLGLRYRAIAGGWELVPSP